MSNEEQERQIFEKLKEININLQYLIENPVVEQPVQTATSTEEDEFKKKSRLSKILNEDSLPEKRLIREITVPIIDKNGHPIRVVDGKFVGDADNDYKIKYDNKTIIGEPVRLKFYESVKKTKNQTYSNKSPAVKNMENVLNEAERNVESRQGHDISDRINEFEDVEDFRERIKEIKEEIKQLKRNYNNGEMSGKEYQIKSKELNKTLNGLEEIIGSQHDGAAYTFEDENNELSIKSKNKVQRDKAKAYQDRETELEEQGKPLVTLHLEKQLFTDKWYFPISRASMENMNVAGRPGWQIPYKGIFKPLIWLGVTKFFGQKAEYSDAEISEKFMYYVYIEDHRKENPEKELLYKISTRSNIGRVDEGDPYYGELWKYTRKSTQAMPTWSVVNRVCENFMSEHSRSKENIGHLYDAGKNGLASLYTEFENKLVITEKAREIKDLLTLDIGRKYEMGLPFKTIPADECEIDEDVFASIVRGRHYTVFHRASNHVYAKIKKNRAKSLLRSIIPFFLSKKDRFKNKFELGKWKMENYEIDVYDRDFIGSAVKEDNIIINQDEGISQGDYLTGTLALFVPFLERSGEYHKARFKFDETTGKPGKYHTSNHSGKGPYNIWQKFHI